MTLTDEALNPEQFRQDVDRARALNQVISDPGEPPKIALPGDPRVTLSMGVPRDGHKGRTDASVREMTGSDEEAIAKLAAADAGFGKVVDAIVQRCTVSVGDKPLTQAEFDHLTVGDRDALFVAVVRLSFGDERQFMIPCGACNKRSEVHFSITEDIKYREVPEDLAWERTVALANDHTAVVTPLLRKQAATLYDGSERTLAEQATLLISECVTEVDGEPMTHDRALALSVRDRRTLIEAINATQTGPIFGDHEVDCPNCGAKMSFTVLGGDLL